MSFRDIAIVFNPKGGSASAGPVNKLVSLLEARGCKVEKLSTTPEPGSATKLAVLLRVGQNWSSPSAVMGRSARWQKV